MNIRAAEVPAACFLQHPPTAQPVLLGSKATTGMYLKTFSFWPPAALREAVDENQARQQLRSTITATAVHLAVAVLHTTVMGFLNKAVLLLCCCVSRLNAMNEIWVPSEWQRQSFIQSGVDATKLVVVPEVRHNTA